MQGGDSSAVVNPGLPNITGSFDIRAYAGGGYAIRIPKGAFTLQDHGGDEAAQGEIETTIDSLSKAHKIRFNASNVSSIYGASSTVQPPAIVLIPQVKY